MLDLLVILAITPVHRVTPAQNVNQPWITAYYVGYQESIMPVSAIDFGPITDLVYFSLMPASGGTLDGASHKVTDDSAKEVEAATHAAGKKVIICIGGAGSGPAYEDAISDANRATFIGSIVDWMAGHNYDGVDIDMEPVKAEDTANFQSFITDLRKAMTARSPGSILTAAAGADQWQPYIPIQDQFDQINLMTYHMSGTYKGWETWYNAPLFNGGRRFKSNGKPLRCIDSALSAWLKSGIPAKRLGIGICFYGAVWNGATGPNQSIDGVKMTTMSYADIMDKLFQPSLYHWDTGPDAPYLSITGSTPQDNQFVSYDDEKLCANKVKFVKERGLGGAIIWELEQGYRANQADKNPLLRAIAGAMR